MTTEAIVQRGTVSGCMEGARRKDSPRGLSARVCQTSQRAGTLVGERDEIGAECRSFGVSLASAKKKKKKDVISLQVLSIDCVKRWTPLRFRKKEANADVPRTCILFFGQQEPSKAVARRLEMIGCFHTWALLRAAHSNRRPPPVPPTHPNMESHSRL